MIIKASVFGSGGSYGIYLRVVGNREIPQTIAVINEQRIYEDDGNGRYTIFSSDDVEYVNPLKHFKNVCVKTDTAMMRDLVAREMPSLPPAMREALMIKHSLKDWKKMEFELRQTAIPQNLLHLLNAASKKEQVRLLKDIAITKTQLRAFIIKAWTDYGFSYSQYTGEHQQKGLDLEKMPALVEVVDDALNKIGTTTLSDGQLKQAIDHRKRTIAKFLDKDGIWHCFFVTYDSLKRKETWKGGQPHYHYISDKFELDRAYVVQSLKSSKYQLGNLPHIDLMQGAA